MNQFEIKEQLEKLNQFDTEALSASSDSAFLSHCLHSEAYAVRAKAYLVLERWGDIPSILSLGDGFWQTERQWQLRFLHIVAVGRVEAALSLTEQCLFQRDCPLLIRGAVVAVAAIGGAKGAEILMKFLKSSFCGYLKDEFIAAALAGMLDRDETAAKTVQHCCDRDVSLRHILEILKTKSSGNELLAVYPYPDYLSRCAEEAGLTPKEWKQLTYFPRRKKKRSAGYEI